jgi:Zn/Cd-binding protein ZinT
MLKELGYNYRIYGGNRKVDEILEELTWWKTAFPKNKDELIEIKKGLITI